MDSVIILSIVLLFMAGMITAGLYFFGPYANISGALVILLNVFGVLLLSWFLYAYMGPKQIISSSVYAVETVQYKDGSSVQIISIDAANKINITEKLKKTLPEGTAIKFTTYSQWKRGIHFTEKFEDTFEVIVY